MVVAIALAFVAAWLLLWLVWGVRVAARRRAHLRDIEARRRARGGYLR